jgi:hypothetical protein
MTADSKSDVLAPVPRVALTREQAAAALGCSLSHFARHIQPELKIIRRGTVRLVPVAELERWALAAGSIAGGRSSR